MASHFELEDNKLEGLNCNPPSVASLDGTVSADMTLPNLVSGDSGAGRFGHQSLHQPESWGIIRPSFPSGAMLAGRQGSSCNLNH